VKKSRVMLPVLTAVAVLILGLFSGLSAGADDGTGAPSTTAASTDPGSSTDPGTTTTDPGSTTTTDPITSTDPETTSTSDPGTTSTSDPGTTSDPATTTAPDLGGTSTDSPVTTTGPPTTDPGSTTSDAGTDAGTPTTTTTIPTETVAGSNTVPPNDATTTQGQGPPPATDPTTTTAAAPPTAPCDTTQLTCGNNASTQMAIVTQTCTASSQNTTLNVNVETLSGAPVNNVVISPTTSCLNVVEITQLVEQYCVGCTVIVIPPPAPVIYVPEPGTVTVVEVPTTITNATTTTVVEQQTSSPPPVHVMAYCMPQPIVRPDGTTGSLLYLPVGEPRRDQTYAGAIPATFIPGVGMRCPTGSTAAPKVPVFTLTVPASFVGQYLRLCLAPAAPSAKPLCRSIRIDLGATIAVPIASNVSATVLKSNVKPHGSKSKKEITQASGAFSSILTSGQAGKGKSAGYASIEKGAKR
jgi:hypothetical protein